MMILHMYSVYDKAVNAYLQPFYARSKGEALRAFTEAVNDQKHTFNKHAADYTLMLVGEFDDSSGVIVPVDPRRIVGAIECLVPDDPFTPETEIRPGGAGNSKNLPM